MRGSLVGWFTDGYFPPVRRAADAAGTGRTNAPVPRVGPGPEGRPAWPRVSQGKACDGSKSNQVLDSHGLESFPVAARSRGGRPVRYRASPAGMAAYDHVPATLPLVIRSAMKGLEAENYRSLSRGSAASTVSTRPGCGIWMVGTRTAQASMTTGLPMNSRAAASARCGP